jgi:RHS repeat-associated protein
VTVGSVADSTDITGIRMGVNRTSSDASRRRGVLAWFADPPTGDSHWVYQKAAANGGYFAYYASTDYGTDHIEPLLGSCTISADHKTAVFAFKALESWGSLSPAASQMDTRLEMSAGSSGSWTSGWTPQASPTFSVDTASGMPAALTCLSAQTTATASWFVGTANNDANTSGRGTVTLSWPAVPLADSYAVYLWDGVKYDQVGTTTATSWATPATLYPTDTQIASIPQGYSGNPFTTYGSKDLRDNPSALCQKMAGAANKDTDYRFKVVPIDAGSGQSPSLAASGELRVTLDNRSVVATGDAAKEDPRHVFYDFAEWDGHSVGALLDQRDLTLAASDLAVASWGPEAAVSRTYNSAVTTAGKGAPGWFFSFECNLQITANQITYTDSARLPHVFAGSGSSWTAPNGFLASLAPDGANWRLSFFDQSYLTFDSSGKLLSETDANGNATTYTWTSGNVTRITAANGQYITLTWTSGKLSGASYATAAGTRSASYATASPWRVTSFPGVTGVERKVLYGYDAAGRLTAITQENWPSAGQSAAMGFLYSSGDLAEVRFADYHATSKPDARATVTYDSATQATVRRYGTVNGVANQTMNQEVYAWSGAAAGVPNQLVSCVTGTGGLANTESYGYAFDRQLATSLSSDGGLTSDTYDTSHDLTSSTQTTGALDAVNEVTTSTYDSLHRVVTETSYQSPTVWALTTNTYTGANLTATQTIDEASTLLSASSSTYDSYGRRTQERQLVSGTVASGTWTQTDTSSFAPCGEPQTTIARSVKLSPSANPQDLTRTSSYDAFGNLLTATDWGARTTETNTYDIAGRQLTSTDAGNVVSRTSYDCMCNPKESWTTANGTQMKADWSLTTYDATGRELTVTTKLSDANGNGTTDSVATTTYDGSGNELTSDGTTLGGQSAKTTCDSGANATEEWAEGVLNYADAGRSLRSVYDAEGDVTYESEVGNPNAPGSGATCTAWTYDDAGSELSVKEPDGSKKIYAYDGQSNASVTEGEATGAGEFSPWDEATSYDASGRAVSKSDAAQSHEGLETTTTLDKLGRVIAQTAVRDGVAQQSTTTSYNDLGWVLESVDANGVTTSTTYDAHGAVVSQTIGTKTTTRSYNATNGRLETVTSADGASLTYTYDAFGRVVRELHQQGGVTLKDIGGSSGTVLDSLGRPASQTEAVAAVTHSWTYPQNTASGTQETINYDGAPLTSLVITRNGREIETSRTATIASGVTATLATADSTSGRDSADRWKQRTIQRTSYAADTQNRAFDAAGRLTSQSGLGFASAGSYTYDANSGRKTAESLPLSLGGTLTGAYTYYPGGSLAVATTNGSEESFTYDEVGNLVSDAVTDTGATSFTYDSANRLTRSDYAEDTDGATPVTTYYGWDTDNAWRTCQGPTPSPTQANSPIDLSYNALGRMSAYANSDANTSALYTYDASGQRVKKEVTVAGTTTTTSFAYDGLTLMKLSATQGGSSWRIDYLYDEEGTAWGGVYRTSSATTYFSLITTDRGDVACLCDADGTAFAAYRYDAWGLPQGAGSYATGIWTQSTSLVTATLAGEIASRQVLRYASYAWDAESALYYCSARYYDPATRQWTTGDPAKADGEESAYQYCGGEPVGAVDGSGRHFVTSRVRYKVASHTTRTATLRLFWRFRWTFTGTCKVITRTAAKVSSGTAKIHVTLMTSQYLGTEDPSGDPYVWVRVGSFTRKVGTSFRFHKWGIPANNPLVQVKNRTPMGTLIAFSEVRINGGDAQRCLRLRSSLRRLVII